MGAVRQGDRAAFQSLYDLFVVELLALCERILHNRADAEDVVAEVFWELWRRRDRYDAQRGGARPYLMTLARSRAIDRLRSQASRPETKGDFPQQPVDAQQLAAFDPLPERSALDAELRTAIVQALAQLDPRQREAMELAYYEGLSHQQIAVRLNSPLGTVKTHIRKGLAKLRHALRSQHDGG
jgi:RNA polymerase sigma-70 factor (ECF subfamily)